MGNAPIEWSKPAEDSFETSKRTFADATMLAHPITGAPVSLTVDASDYAVGAVLQQRANDVWQPLGFAAKSLHNGNIARTIDTTCDVHGRKTLPTRRRR